MIKGYKFYSHLVNKATETEFAYCVEFADYANDYSPSKAKAKLIRQTKKNIKKWSDKGYETKANIYCDGVLIQTIEIQTT